MFVSHRTRGLEGYTMMEIMVVLVLAGILMTIAVPRMELSQLRVDSSMRTLGSAVMTAQRVALKRQHDVVVAFDAAAGAIRIHEDANNNGLVDPGERVRSETLGDAVAFGQGDAPRPGFLPGTGSISFGGRQNGLPTVTFHRSGSTSEEGGAFVTTRRAQETGTHPEDTRVLHIERSTGRVIWYRYTSDGWERGS